MSSMSICARGTIVVTHGRLGSGKRALGDRQRIGIEQFARMRRTQQIDQLLAVLGLAQQRCESRSRKPGFDSNRPSATRLPVRVRIAKTRQDFALPVFHDFGLGAEVSCS